MSKTYLAVNFEFCNSCNLSCKMCSIYYKKKMGDAPKMLPFKKWKKGILSLDRFIDYRVDLICHWVGEPTLHPEFDKMIKFAFFNNKNNSLFRHFHFSTNGILIDKWFDAIFQCVDMKNQSRDTFNYINFSLDAFHRETYKKIKGEDALEKVKTNLLGFMQKQKARGVNYPKIHISFVVMEENKNEARDFLNYWKKQFERYSFPYEVDFLWPKTDNNAIYFRRLSSREQEKANKLHLDLIKRLGIFEETEKNSQLLARGEF